MINWTDIKKSFQKRSPIIVIACLFVILLIACLLVFSLLRSFGQEGTNSNEHSKSSTIDPNEIISLPQKLLSQEDLSEWRQTKDSWGDLINSFSSHICECSIASFPDTSEVANICFYPNGTYCSGAAFDGTFIRMPDGINRNIVAATLTPQFKSASYSIIEGEQYSSITITLSRYPTIDSAKNKFQELISDAKTEKLTKIDFNEEIGDERVGVQFQFVHHIYREVCSSPTYYFRRNNVVVWSGFSDERQNGCPDDREKSEIINYLKLIDERLVSSATPLSSS